MPWQPVVSILNREKLLFEYDADRRLVRYTHRRGTQEVVDLARYHLAEDLAEQVATKLEAVEGE